MSARRRTGFVFHHSYLWHNAGSAVGWHPTGIRIDKGMYNQHELEHCENATSKRRIYELIGACGLLDKLTPIATRLATVFHTPEYVQMIKKLSDGAGGNAGYAPFGTGSYEIACRAVGGCMEAVDAVMEGRVDNAYALVRPPGHHAERDRGLGFCLFANCALAAMHARAKFGLKRIAIVDFDVHHGNGTQQAFYEDSSVLFISLHQDNLYPNNSGHVDDIGENDGLGFTVNVPLPPGTGSGGYQSAFARVVVPAVDAFRPELILVSCGFDAGALDPLAHMMLNSSDFRLFTRSILSLADRHCGGRAVFIHEGGYSKDQAPFCGLAVVEELSGIHTGVVDPFSKFVESLGYQQIQPLQDTCIRAAMANLEAHLYKQRGYRPSSLVKSTDPCPELEREKTRQRDERAQRAAAKAKDKEKAQERGRAPYALQSKL